MNTIASAGYGKERLEIVLICLYMITSGIDNLVSSSSSFLSLSKSSHVFGKQVSCPAR
jgi:hypothetical protein